MEYDEILKYIKQYKNYIEERPDLLSILYDCDLLPEQIISLSDTKKFIVVCELYKRIENGNQSKLSGN